ncbi:MAG: N-acetylglucosamine-6-phosphate deacetylase [Chloroflexota bacterium]
MSLQVITNATVLLLNDVIQQGWVAFADGTIQDMGAGVPPTGQAIDAQGAYLLPGFVDVHVHGAVGHDVMDASLDNLHSMSAFFARCGVTSWLPTTLTASHEDTLKALHAVKQAMAQPAKGAHILGAHLEGPYLNIEKCGAQDTRYIRRASLIEIDDILALDVVRLASIAPEFPENIDAIKQMKQHGITVSAAHTAATYEQMQAGIEAGITHSTHTFNAMPSIHHRHPGGLTALLLDESVYCEVIADGIHVHPATLQLLIQTKGIDKTILITDAMRATGIGAGQYKLGDYDVTVDDRRATLADGTLAGSILTMDVALRNLLQIADYDIADIWRTTSYNATQSIGIDNKGLIQIGYDADFVLVNQDVDVIMTICAGDCVFDAHAT